MIPREQRDTYVNMRTASHPRRRKLKPALTHPQGTSPVFSPPPPRKIQRERCGSAATPPEEASGLSITGLLEQSTTKADSSCGTGPTLTTSKARREVNSKKRGEKTHTGVKNAHFAVCQQVNTTHQALSCGSLSTSYAAWINLNCSAASSALSRFLSVE